MHAKTDSEGTSINDATWPPRSPPRRPIYYVQSPSHPDVEKMSYGSSPTGSPAHHYYHCSPIHHSRESSTSRFSASLKNPRGVSAWRHVQLDHKDDDGDDEEMDGRDEGSRRNVRLYVCIGFFFVLLFTVFCLILWGASKPYKPKIIVKVILYILLFSWFTELIRVKPATQFTAFIEKRASISLLPSGRGVVDVDGLHAVLIFKTPLY